MRYFLYIIIAIIVFFAGRRSVVITREITNAKRPTYSYTSNLEYWIQIENSKLYKKKYSIVMFGNSLIGSVHWNEFLNREDIANRGVGGDVSDGMLSRISSVIDCKPKICFIEGGINDIGHRLSYRNFITNTAAIIDTLQRHNIKPVLFSILYVGDSCKDATYVNPIVSIFNKGIDSMATIKKVEIINLNTILCPKGNLLSEYSLRDGVHMNAKAYHIWSDEIMKTLTKYSL